MASVSSQGASSSSTPSSSTRRWKYDVFLSYRDKDTGDGFTDDLYTHLVRKCIFTFRDKEKEKLGSGNLVSPDLMKAIEESRIAIVILSREYVSSTRCLDELAKIVKCMKEMEMIVLSVFYGVDLSHVRDQSGTFEQAFTERETSYSIQKVETRRNALREVANVSAWHVEERKYESEIIQHIVEHILLRLSSTFSSITKDLIGMDSRMEELITLYLGLGDSVCMTGIWGLGGIGKTTLARVIYETKRNNFDGSSFIFDTREVSKKHGLVQLQKQLLGQILEERNIDIWDVQAGADMIKRRLHHKKVLLVLDDVNNLEQLEKLVGECCWFGSGSWIIITTRDEHLLIHHGVHNIYKLDPLNKDDSLKLFCLKAFKNVQPVKNYIELSCNVTYRANGLPLALVMLASILARRSIVEWKSALESFSKFPERNIFDLLKLSYDKLEDMWKEIFLDIACFFCGKEKDHVIEILENCGFDARIGMCVLVDVSLVVIRNNKLWMHDLVQELGREIVRQESRSPGERSRLWNSWDLLYVLKGNTATKKIQAIVIDEFEGNGECLKLEAWLESLSKMCNLRLLIIYDVHILNGLSHLSYGLRSLERHRSSSKNFPSSLQSKVLVELKLLFSKTDHLWIGLKHFEKLKVIDLGNSKNLFRIPDFTAVPRLERLCLRGCINLVEIHPSIGQLSMLTDLNLEFCRSLIDLPSKMDGLRSLEILILFGCSKLTNLPENLGKIKCLKELDLTGTAIREVPSSISFLICRGCEKQYFKSKLDSVLNFDLLKYLSLSTNYLVFTLPASISQLPKLVSLNLRNCIRLHSLPELPSNVRYVNAKDCSSLEPSPGLLSLSNLSQPSISFFNCFKLVEYNESSDGLAFAILKRYLQGLILPKTALETSNKRKDRPGAAFNIIIPGLEVPQWLTHQRFGYSLSIELAPDWCNSRWMGFAFCAFLKKNCYGYSSKGCSLIGRVIALGDMHHRTFKVFGETSFEVVIGETSFDYSVGHLWLLYCSRDDLLDTNWNDHECRLIKVVIDSNSPSVVVIKCAARLIYEQDVEEFNQTIAQCSSSCVNTSEVSDCVHHEFENSATVTSCKIKRIYDDNSEAEPGASLSFPEESERCFSLLSVLVARIWGFCSSCCR